MITETPVSIIPKHTYTKTAYARAYGISRPTVDLRIKNKQIKSIEINGAVLLIAEVLSAPDITEM